MGVAQSFGSAGYGARRTILHERLRIWNPRRLPQNISWNWGERKFPRKWDNKTGARDISWWSHSSSGWKTSKQVSDIQGQEVLIDESYPLLPPCLLSSLPISVPPSLQEQLEGSSENFQPRWDCSRVWKRRRRRRRRRRRKLRNSEVKFRWWWVVVWEDFRDRSLSITFKPGIVILQDHHQYLDHLPEVNTSRSIAIIESELPG